MGVLRAVGATQCWSCQTCDGVLVAAIAFDQYNDVMNGIELTTGRSATLLDACMYPGISPLEISSLYSVASSTVYDDVKFLKGTGLVFEAGHGSIHVPNTTRLWPTPLGIDVAAAGSGVTISEFMRTHPVSQEWRRATVDRMDGLASTYRLFTTVAELDGCRPLALGLFRSLSYDAIIETDDGRTIGIVRQGMMRDDRGLQRRLDEIEYLLLADVCPSVLLIMAPCRRTRYLIARGIADDRKGLRSRVNVYVGTESADLLTDHESDLWLSTTPLHPLIALKTLVSRADRGPFVYPTEDVNNSPPGDDFPFDAPTFHLTKGDKMLMEVLADRPRIRREDLLTLTDKISGVLTRHVGRLKRHGGLVEQKGARGRLRYMLSQEGVDYMARRDRAHVGLARSTWSGELSANDKGTVVPRGHVIQTIRRESKSTDGLYRLVSHLIADVRDHPDYALEYLLPSHRTDMYVEPRVSIRPDASAGILHRGETYIQFHLEYERRARYTGGLNDKLEPYRRFFASKRIRFELPQYYVPVLFVFPDETIEERFVNMAVDTECGLPVLSSNSGTLDEQGFLGSAWRAVWGHRVFALDSMSEATPFLGHPLDYRRMPLTDLIGYRWIATYNRTFFCDDKLDEARRASPIFEIEIRPMEIVALARIDSDHEWRGPEKLP